MSAAGRKIVAEFQKDSGGRLTLWAVTTITEETNPRDGHRYLSRKTYDVEKSRQFGYLYHQSGGGGAVGAVPVEGIYFASGGTELKERPCQLVGGTDKPPWRGKKTRAIRKRNKTRRLRALPKASTPPIGGDLIDVRHDVSRRQESRRPPARRPHV